MTRWEEYGLEKPVNWICSCSDVNQLTVEIFKIVDVYFLDNKRFIFSKGVYEYFKELYLGDCTGHY